MKGNKYKDIVGLTLEQRLKGEKRPISSDTTEVPKKRKKTKKVTSVKENVAVAEPIETDSPAKAKKKLRRKKKLAKEAIDLVTKLVDETKESDSSDSEVSDIRETESTPKPQLKKKDVKKKEEKEKPKSTSEKLQERLKGSHFRYLNEQLYKCTTEEAENLFKNDPDAFQAYHQGFTDQSARWPVNPLDLIIADLNKKSKNLIVADVGCGDARLARSVEQKVHSFDLFAVNDAVTVANMARLPLQDESVDICVFCLSLMNSDVSNILVEANRVLKKGGSLRIAEILSRFFNVKNFRRSVEKLGFRLVKKTSPNDMFILFDFEKMKSTTAKDPAGLHLKPCLYKKR